MKGCECILEDIVFAEQEDLPRDAVAGEPLVLEYMPISLILRAVKAAWILTSDCLPSLPEALPRNGLFQSRPSQVYYRRKLEQD
eukprot:3370709-Karenia_brevis.AAC.1